MSKIAFIAKKGQPSALVHKNHAKSSIEYGRTIRAHAGWNKRAFCAPSTGEYFISVWFEEKQCDRSDGQSGVRVHLRRNGQIIGSARSGMGTDERGAGAYTTIIKLSLGDVIDTVVEGDPLAVELLGECGIAVLLVAGGAPSGDPACPSALGGPVLMSA
jgi:hypothetical protein